MTVLQYFHQHSTVIISSILISQTSTSVLIRLKSSFQQVFSNSHSNNALRTTKLAPTMRPRRTTKSNVQQNLQTEYLVPYQPISPSRYLQPLPICRSLLWIDGQKDLVGPWVSCDILPPLNSSNSTCCNTHGFVWRVRSR